MGNYDIVFLALNGSRGMKPSKSFE